MKKLELPNRLLDQELRDFEEERKNYYEKYDVKIMSEQQFEAQLIKESGRLGVP